MKRKLLPLLIAGLTVGAAGTAMAGAPTIYGKANVTVHKNDFQSVSGGAAVDSQDNWSMESNASRLGVKGDFDVADGLKAIYKLEYEIFVDDGTDSSNDEFSARNIYAGLQGGWGTVIAGRNDTPLKLAQGEVDRFNDLVLGDINYLMVGENRANNMIMYSTPSMSGFGFTIGAVALEENGVDDDDDDDSLTDGFSTALTFTSEAVYLALAADSNVGSTDAYRAVGEVSFGPAKIGAIYQMAEAHDDEDVISPLGGSPRDLATFANLPGANPDGFEEQDAYIVSGEVKLGGPWKLKAQYGYSESSTVAAGFDDTEVTQMALGVDYKLNDNAKLFAYYAQVETEGDSIVTADTVEDSTFAVGFDFKF